MANSKKEAKILKKLIGKTVFKTEDGLHYFEEKHAKNTGRKYEKVTYKKD